MTYPRGTDRQRKGGSAGAAADFFGPRETAGPDPRDLEAVRQEHHPVGGVGHVLWDVGQQVPRAVGEGGGVDAFTEQFPDAFLGIADAGA